MSHAYEIETPRRPSYADIEALPPNVVGEILGGELFVSPRPAGPHTRVASMLGGILVQPFWVGVGGPGGWVILDEPELSLGVDPGFDPVVPDLAGWRINVMSGVPSTAQISVCPQWVCEVLSPSTQRADRVLKLPFYGRAGVEHAWLIDPVAETLEVFALKNGVWTVAGSHSGDDVVRAAPFDAIELALSWLWGRRPAEPDAESSSDAE